MKYKAVIFDWDGTLADSTDGIVMSMQYAANKLGVAARSDFDIQQIIGLGLAEAIQTLWPEHEGDQKLISEVAGAYAEFYMSEKRPPISLFDRVADMLDDLRSAQHKLGIATGKARRGLTRALQETGLSEAFHETRCADETRSKPHPLMLEELQQVLRLDVSEMVMVGDTQFDIEMGKRAGMSTIAITHGAHTHEKLSQAAPDYVVHSIEELHQCLR